MHIDCLVLPVAPHANNRVRFDNSPAAKRAMLPGEAVAWIGDLIKGGKQITAVDLKGPGDCFASPKPTLETLGLLHAQYPDLETRVSVLGLGGAPLADSFAGREVGRFILEVDGVSPDIVKRIYAWIRPGKKTIPLAQSADLLVKEQAETVAALQKAGQKINIRTTVYPGINDQHIAAIAKKMASMGAQAMTLVPYRADEDEQDGPPSCDAALLAAAEKAAAEYLGVSTNDEEYIAPPIDTNFKTIGGMLPKPSKERPNVAVVSSNGMDVDLHLGQATKLLVYGPREDGLACMLESRMTPESGKGDARWQRLANECLYDCFALLASNAGDNPQKILAEQGVKVIVTEDNIEGTVDVLYGGGKKKKCKK